MIIFHIQPFREYQLALFQFVLFQSKSSALKIQDWENCASKRKKGEMSGQEPGDEKEYHGDCLNYSVPSKTE